MLRKTLAIILIGASFGLGADSEHPSGSTMAGWGGTFDLSVARLYGKNALLGGVSIYFNHILESGLLFGVQLSGDASFKKVKGAGVQNLVGPGVPVPPPSRVTSFSSFGKFGYAYGPFAIFGLAGVKSFGEARSPLPFMGSGTTSFAVGVGAQANVKDFIFGIQFDIAFNSASSMKVFNPVLGPQRVYKNVPRLVFQVGHAF